MKMYLKRMELSNFKGCKSASYEFDECGNVISGANGIGKTTLATAFMWCFLGKDYALASNPNVVPNNAEEASPKAMLTLDVDGKEITLEKVQKIRKSKDGKISTVNSYNVNGVEKSQTAFEAYFTDLGFDFGRFAYMTNPNAFMGEKSKDMREMLFSMVSEKSDIDIANGMDGVSETAKLLESYTMQEVEAMQKQTIRKITEEHGKSGELTQSRIQGMEESKVDIDVAEQELAKADIERRIAELDEKIRTGNSGIDDLRGQDMRLQEEISVITQTMNQELHKKHNELSVEISNLEWKAKNILDKVIKCQDMLAKNNSEISSFSAKKEEINRQWKENESKVFDESPYQFDESKWVFDESTTVCSLCGQTLPGDKIIQLRAEFSDKKETALQNMLMQKEEDRQDFVENKKITKETLTEQANAIKQREAELRTENEKLQKEIAELQGQQEQAEAKKSELEKQLATLPSEADYSQNEEYAKLASERDKVLEELNRLKMADNMTSEYETEKAHLEVQLDEVKGIIAKAQRNAEIDEMIADLRKKWKEYEQNKADAERILYQLKLIAERKEDLLTEEINSHFETVVWVLYSIQKNGERVTDCYPTVDGYKFGESTNTGREMLAKLDICHSLQRFYGQYYPIWLDNSESLNSINIPSFDDTQTFILKAKGRMFIDENGDLREEDKEHIYNPAIHKPVYDGKLKIEKVV